MATGICRPKILHARAVFQPGFTLIELMLILVIAAILASVASPAMSTWIESARSKAIRQQITSLLADARYRALSRAEILTVCRLEANQCSGDFGLPLSAFVDLNRDAILDADEVLLGTADAEISEQVRIRWNRADGYLRFWPNGGTGALTGSVTYCDSGRPGNDFRIVVARTGRIRVDQEQTGCNQVTK